jgi:hypothetical protein
MVLQDPNEHSSRITGISEEPFFLLHGALEVRARDGGCRCSEEEDDVTSRSISFSASFKDCIAPLQDSHSVKRTT